MTKLDVINDFVSQKNLALLGASQKGNKFGNIACKELLKKGYNISLVHPKANQIAGITCYKKISEVPGPVDGALLVIPPRETDSIIKEIAEAGIKRVWMQQGSESIQAIELCEKEQIKVVHGECILMFAEPVGLLHKFHRGIWKLIGKYPV